MPETKGKQAAKGVAERTGTDPIIMAAIGSVLLAWFQYYVRGNQEHGLFIGLWAPTLLAFSCAVQINEITNKVETRTSSPFGWLSLD